MIEAILRDIMPLYRDSYKEIEDTFRNIPSRLSAPDYTNKRMIAVLGAETIVREYAVTYLKMLSSVDFEDLGDVGKILKKRFGKIHPMPDGLQEDNVYLKQWFAKERRVTFPKISDSVIRRDRLFFEYSPIALAHMPCFDLPK